MSIWKGSLGDANEKYFWTYPFWEQGLRLKQSPDKNKGYMDEAAVRARAGVIHIILWTTLLLGLATGYPAILWVGPFMFYDMIAGVLFGLTPFCPTGVIGTIIAWSNKPFYTPSAPRRLAWVMGAVMAVICVTMRILFGNHKAIKTFILSCILLTFMESSLGFCAGCWIYKKLKKSKDDTHDAISVKVKDESENEDADEDEDEMVTCSIEPDAQANICGS